MKILFLLLTTGITLADTSLDVIHKKSLWFDQEGSIRIDALGISFHPTGKDETRSWDYQDIQFFDRLSPTEFRLLTYEDVAWRLGQDRRYHFEITSGEFSNELFAEVAEDPAPFRAALDRFFEGEGDGVTPRLLAQAG